MKRLLLLLLAALPLAAQAQIRVVVLGSSTAEGVGSSPRDSAWVNRYRVYLSSLDSKNAVNNFGRGGYTTYHIRPTGSVVPTGRPAPDTQRNITWAMTYDPDAIFINMPSNDATNGYTVAEQLRNYDEILAAAGDVPVWVATTQPRNLSTTGRANLMAMRDSTFARFGDRALDFWSDIAQADGTIAAAYNSGDGIHLNNAGHRVLFQRVVAADLVSAITTEAAQEAQMEPLRVAVQPNPFRTQTHLTFTLATPGPATLRVFDPLGREVARLVDTTLPAGPHRFPFDAVALPAGVYLYRLHASGITRSGTLIHAR